MLRMKTKLTLNKKRKSTQLVMKKLPAQNPQVKKENPALKIDVIKLKLF